MYRFQIKYLISIIVLVLYIFTHVNALSAADKNYFSEYDMAILDTAVAPGDTIYTDDKKQLPDSTKKSKSFRDDVLDIIRGSIFVDSTRIQSDGYDDDFIKSEKEFLPFVGKIIGRIRLKTVDIFGASVMDTSYASSSWLSKSANSLHIKTRERILYENLFFKVGDPVDPYILADNARVIRRLPYIQDARILVIPRLNERDIVDVIVITQDVFSIGLSADVIKADNFRLNVFDRNFLGLGSELNNVFYYRGDHDPAMGYEFKYQHYNIRGTFISATINYLHDFEREGWRIGFARNFLTPSTKYAGGLDLSRMNYNVSNSVIFGYTVNNIDTWLGRSFLIKEMPTRKNIVFALRYVQDRFTSRPFVSADSNYVYHNRKIVLGNITFYNVDYFKSRMILSFGRTEDVPLGFRLQYTAGYSDNEFKRRYYSGWYIGYAFRSNWIGYLLLTTEVGGFLNQDRIEDGVIRVRSVYFSHLSHLSDYRLRQFISINYTKGIRRSTSNKIDIRNRNGIVGLSHDSMEGMQRLAFNFETVCFTPWRILGFKIAAVARSDVGFIGAGNKPPFVEDLFIGVGMGFRIRNEGLVFKTINFGLFYYPIVPAGVSHIGYGFSTSEPAVFESYLGSKPSVIQFK